MSGVVVPASTVAASASSARSAARPSASSSRRVASQRSSIVDERTMAIGLATSLPAMSGALPCEACAIARSSEALMDPAVPRDPAISPVRSDRMSPNMFSVTMTSKVWAWRSRCTVAASMCRSSTVTSGYSCPTSRHTSRNRPVVICSTLALWTIVTCFLRPMARRKASWAMRSVARRVMMPCMIAMSGAGIISPVPRTVLRSA